MADDTRGPTCFNVHGIDVVAPIGLLWLLDVHFVVPDFYEPAVFGGHHAPLFVVDGGD